MTLQFAGRGRGRAPEGVDELPGKVSYFIGNDPTRWRRGVPLYAKVKYRNVAPGIDLVFYANGANLEFDVIVAPGGDPSAIRWRVSGGAGLSFDANGDLILASNRGELRLRRPVAYQDAAPARRQLNAGFVRRGVNVVGVRVDDHDATRPLVIDPVLVFSTYLGGNTFDWVNAVASDRDGGIYVAGFTYSDNFPTVNPVQASTKFGGDAFVTKLNSAGTAILYSTYLGGRDEDRVNSLAVDGGGQAYLTGWTASTDFPTTPGVIQRELARCSGADGLCMDAFVTRLTADGSGLVYSTYLGGDGPDAGYGIAVDGEGDAFVTGQASRGSFPHTHTIPPDGALTDMFVAKLSPDGTRFVYSTIINGFAIGGAVAVDTAGCAYVVGAAGSQFLPVVNAFQGVLRGGWDAFALKLSADGAALLYSTYLGGSGSDGAEGVAVDQTGRALVVGGTSSPDFPTVNALQGTLRGSSDGFVTVLDPSGSSLAFSTYLGGSATDVVASVALDAAGNVYLSGATASADFPVVRAWQPELAGWTAAFVAKLDRWFRSIVWSSFLGGAGDEWTRQADGLRSSVGLGGANTVIVAGTTASPTFPLLNALQPVYGGPVSDGFVVKVKEETTGGLAATVTGSPTAGPVPLAVSLLSSVSGGTAPYTFDWDFGDGSAHATDANPTHTYATPGSYVVTLKVNDAVSTAAEANLVITAKEPCALSCTASAPLSAYIRVFARFAATATTQNYCGTPTFRWDFGDGQFSTEQNPTHVYPNPGVYTWAMTATAGALTCQKSGAITSSASQSPPLMIPALAHIPGTNNTQWRSDVAVATLRDFPSPLALVYFSQQPPIFRTATVPARGTIELRDLVTTVFNLPADAQSSGTVHVIPEQPVVVTARTYNQTETGTLGQSYPALSPTDGFSSDKVGVLPQLKRNAAYRTNIGAINLGTSECTVAITLHGTDGATLGQAVSLTLVPGRWQQINNIFGVTGAGDQDLAYATVEVKTQGGRAWAYASVIDNATGDPTTVPVLLPF